MKEWTGIEIERAVQGLEQASATLLGRMIFEFSRLDVALGLLLVWSDNGKQLDELTGKVEDTGFNKKLEHLKALVVGKYGQFGMVQSPYAQWLNDADSVRQLRNEFVHGRWGVEPIKNRVINIIGLPTSPDQRTVEYTIADLKRVVEQMVELQQRLSVLRSESPL